MTVSRARLALVVAMLGLSAWGCGAASAGGDGGAAAAGGGNTGGNAGGNGVAGGNVGGSGGTPTGGAGGGQVAGQGGVAGQSDGGGVPPSDGGGDSVGDGATGTAPLTQFLRIIQVTTVQGTTTVSISIDGQKNHNGAIHAGEALTMRIHVRPDTGWVAHPTVCELHVVNASMDVTLSATRTITVASSAADINSTFNFDLTAAQVTKDLKFSVALRDPTGMQPDAPPAIQRALYPRDGTFDTLDAQ